MTEEARQAFEVAYPHMPYPASNKEVSKMIHYSHLKREWDGFQKGWQAALAYRNQQVRSHIQTAFDCLPSNAAGACYELRRALTILSSPPEAKEAKL